jgi:GNAT superfamily N-acetyltransferase
MIEQRRGELLLSTDPRRMEIDQIHRYLSEESYWAEGIPRDVVARSLANSLCVGVFDGDLQVALTRVITDYATYAYLCDVYVLESHRKRGIGHWMLEAIDIHPDLQNLRRWGLITRDAHALYAAHGYAPLAKPENYMERVYRDVYVRGS